MVKKNLIKEKIVKFPDYLKAWVKEFTGGLTIFCLVIFTLIPFLSRNENFLNSFLRQFSLAMIYAIFAASWDLLTGISGQISFGHAIFFGISGYITAYFSDPQYYGLPIPIAIALGVGGAVIFGLVIGVPCLRLKGPYLALGTLAFSLILVKLFLMGSLSHIFFGSEGISDPRFKLSVVLDPIAEYFIIFISMIIVFIIIIQISKSKFGTILKSIRDDETGSDASGINTTKYKIYAFMLSSMFAGVAGAFYATWAGAVNPTGNFGTVISFFAILMASLGGITTIRGSAIGAFFFVFVEYALISLGAEAYVHLIFALILILVIRFAEHGIFRPIIEHLKDLWDILLGR